MITSIYGSLLVFNILLNAVPLVGSPIPKPMPFTQQLHNTVPSVKPAPFVLPAF